MMYKLKKETIVDTTPERAWEFIRNPDNLNEMVPEDMRFTIISDVPDEMFEGMHIEYRVKIPLLGRRKWVSELKNIVQGTSFVDEQLIGPYKHWHHYHLIEPAEGGVRFTDIVDYEMPFGCIGRLVHAFFVGSKLEHIFSFREERLHQLLSAQSKSAEEKITSE